VTEGAGFQAMDVVFCKGVRIMTMRFSRSQPKSPEGPRPCRTSPNIFSAKAQFNMSSSTDPLSLPKRKIILKKKFRK